MSDAYKYDINKKKTGDRIRKLMADFGLKARDIQHALNLKSEQAVYRWLRGETVPDAVHLVRLSILFECDIGDIIEFVPDNAD